jgi:hypothetical protein
LQGQRQGLRNDVVIIDEEDPLIHQDISLASGVPAGAMPRTSLKFSQKRGPTRGPVR